MLKPIASAAFLVAWGGLIYSVMFTSTTNAALRTNTAPAVLNPAPPANKPPQPTKRAMPQLTTKEKDMLAVALGEESGIDTHKGKQAMLNVVLNRLGTTHTRVRVRDVLLEENQFSFMWGKTQTEAGRVLLGGNAKEIARLARKKYPQELAFVLSVVNQPTYTDVTGGRIYYYNKQTSSERGKQWFIQNTRGCQKIGEYHTFCHPKTPKEGI